MQSPRQPEPGPDPAQGVFAISVAAELVGLAPRNLRQYEERGLLEPARTDGGTRRYSSDDVLRLRRIGELLAAGLNTAGVSLVLDLERRNEQLQLALDQHQALVEHRAPD
jgi:MerR family transcriptional regulator/heat shock protein HspR